VRNCVAALGVSRGNPRTLPGFWKKDFAFSWEAGDLPGGMVVYIHMERSGVCKLNPAVGNVSGSACYFFKALQPFLLWRAEW